MTHEQLSQPEVKETMEQSKPIEDKAQAQALYDALMETIGELITVLERETALLRKADAEGLPALQLRKQALSTTLTKHMRHLQANSDAIKKIAPRQLEELKGQQRLFEKSLQANHDALSAMRMVSEQLIETIAEKVHGKRGGPTVYGKDAGLKTANKKQTAAISYDSVL